MNWRDIINQYLTARATDERNRLLTEQSDEYHQFIENYSSEGLRQWENEKLQSLLNRTEEPLSSPDSYEIVQEQNDLLIAEVQPALNGHPYKLTRFRLIRNQGQWQLDDYLWECQCSNGDCNWCGGTGVCAVCGGEGQCNFCSGEHVCQLCKGESTCRSCKDSYMPGWFSMTRKR